MALADLSFFYRQRTCGIRLPDVYPVACKSCPRETLDAWTSSEIFYDLLVSLLESRILSCTSNVLQIATQAVKRALHAAYDLATGHLNTSLLSETIWFKKRLRNRDLVDSREINSLLKQKKQVKQVAREVTLDDALDTTVVLELYRRFYEVPESLPEDPIVSIFDHSDFATDHVTACYLSMVTTVGVLALKHFSHINTMPSMTPLLRFERMAERPRAETKWRNYITAIGWAFLVVSEIVMCKSRNDLIRALYKAKGLCVEDFLVKSVHAIDPSMSPYMCYFASLILRMVPAACRMHCFKTFKSNIDFEDYFIPSGPTPDSTPDSTPENSTTSLTPTISAQFPKFFVEYETPIVYNATLLCHHTTIICKTGMHLWSFLTTKRAWALRSVLGYQYAEAIFLREFPIPKWCFTVEDLADVRKSDALLQKKLEHEQIEHIVSSLNF